MLRLDPLELDAESRALDDRFVPATHLLRPFDAAPNFSFVLPLVAARDPAKAGPCSPDRLTPVGSLRSSTGTLPTERLFTGQVRDLGDDRFYFFKSRSDDATIGKFHSPDSVVPNATNPQALNRSAYALNNPLKLVDPSGHLTEGQIDADLKQQEGNA